MSGFRDWNVYENQKVKTLRTVEDEDDWEDDWDDANQSRDKKHFEVSLVLQTQLPPQAAEAASPVFLPEITSISSAASISETQVKFKKPAPPPPPKKRELQVVNACQVLKSPSISKAEDYMAPPQKPLSFPIIHQSDKYIYFITERDDERHEIFSEIMGVNTEILAQKFPSFCI